MAQFNAFEEAIDFSFWREICDKHEALRHFRRGEYFARTGEVLKIAGWIVSGGFKHSLIDDFGNAKTVGFVFEGSVVLVIPASMIRDRLMFDPTLFIKCVDALFEQVYGQVLNVYRFTPEQRYRQLLSRYPRLFELVSLGEIATYLNISRRHLHRIRETIAANAPDEEKSGE